jgi:hypothetical protein
MADEKKTEKISLEELMVSLLAIRKASSQTFLGLLRHVRMTSTSWN